MILLSVLLGGVAAWLLLPTASDLWSLLRLSRRRASGQATDDERPARLLILVPAHDEEILLGDCLRSLRAMTHPRESTTVVVIADNCTDRTADVAREGGVSCLERFDKSRTGKPHAIAWALERVDLDSHDALIIVDADSRVEPSFAAALAARAPLRQKAFQPFNDVGNRSASKMSAMAGVFSTSRFLFMNRLKERAGLNVPLGNGLCIGSDILQRYGWEAYSLSEDWEVYALLTLRGIAIENVPAAHICSQEAVSLRQSSTQRQRWSAGRIDVLRRVWRPLLASSGIGAHQKLDAIAELSNPGPAAHLGIAILMAGVTLLLHPPGAWWIAGAVMASVARPVVYTIAAISAEREPGRALLSFAFLPIYVLWRLGLQGASLLRSGERRWIRTKRHEEISAAK
jgi:cellulose synthase/poly-beta-1,6-N-acetylglucosamine synthase-like glycosyltransferase